MDQSIKYLDLGWTGLRRGIGTGAAHAVRPPREPKGPAAGEGDGAELRSLDCQTKCADRNDVL